MYGQVCWLCWMTRSIRAVDASGLLQFSGTSQTEQWPGTAGTCPLRHGRLEWILQGSTCPKPRWGYGPGSAGVQENTNEFKSVSVNASTFAKWEVTRLINSLLPWSWRDPPEAGRHAGHSGRPKHREDHQCPWRLCPQLPWWWHHASSLLRTLEPAHLLPSG